MVYEAFRTNGGPTQHPANYYPVTADILAAGFIFAFALLGFTLYLIAPGFRGKESFFFLIRVTVSLFIGAAVILGVIGQDWESSEIHTKTFYKAFTSNEINASIGVKVGLASVNITLKDLVKYFLPFGLGDPVEQIVDETHLPENNTHWMERIDYNERFTWAWRQGRFGFGPYAGRIAQEFRDAQYRGLPYPILWIAEYFVLDGELIRWGRSFRTAGWYTYQTLWTAFPLWIVANILSVMVLFYSGWAFILTGTFMLISNVIYATIRWGSQPLFIPFEDDILYFYYGPSFWLTMAGGIVSVLYGIIIVTMDLWAPQKISDFFGIDVLQDSEEYYHRPEEPEVEEVHTYRSGNTGGAIRRIQARGKKSTRFSRSSRRKPRVLRSDGESGLNPAYVNNENPVYANTDDPLYANAGDPIEMDDMPEHTYDDVGEARL